MTNHSGSSGYDEDEEDIELWEDEMLLLLDEEDEEDEGRIWVYPWLNVCAVFLLFRLTLECVLHTFLD